MGFKFEVPECTGENKVPLGSAMVMHVGNEAKFCTFCERNSHFSNECESAFEGLEDSVPKICPPDHLRELSKCLKQLAAFHRSDELTRSRKVSISASLLLWRYRVLRSCNFASKAIVRNLTDVLRATYPNMQLEMFGSCANGFEVNCSDIDISVKFHKDPEDGKEVAYAYFRDVTEQVCIVMKHDCISCRHFGFLTTHAPVCFSLSKIFARSCIKMRRN